MTLSDDLKWGLMLLAMFAGFGIAAWGSFLSGTHLVTALCGPFSLTCLILAIRSFGRATRN